MDGRCCVLVWVGWGVLVYFMYVARVVRVQHCNPMFLIPLDLD